MLLIAWMSFTMALHLTAELNLYSVRLSKRMINKHSCRFRREPMYLTLSGPWTDSMPRKKVLAKVRDRLFGP